MSHGFGLEGQRRQLPTPPPAQRFLRHLHAPPGHALHHAGRKQPSGAGCEQPEGRPAGPLVAPGERPGPGGTRFAEAGAAGWVPAAASIQRSCCGVCVGCEVGCFGRWFIFFFSSSTCLVWLPLVPHLMLPPGMPERLGRTPPGTAGCATAPRPSGAR